ncbi:hypothetical protein CNAG_01986 [Cryptococcus neoformans var. grubii H99]|uniref:Extracellular membrane protein CFEM domain-containing protein n=1 Tax=Cryptococcus neoformans (strain H99 / ATCC 208821 / CBS 10515 / FGSC 9487) TaxID=235443 RepID=J9W236_CRYN9|nr:hypothetical protein CNAG_01986 [Cryptococcus neoformans var. grubii H99]AFR98180.1 hypothetical protein CNAG_01986 [Cryptococcus neoformans var. grubii H99]AUB28288.1 hypothetical protein CKF44_01986 [Cryptococcus neoformans var. grubii]|eukprot:XP_012052890.1 hypothetical protein CNAG_01986 [Cryptococcus neoformans var. grubii H99]
MVRAGPILFVLSLAGCALAQDSSATASDYTIQTSPPEPPSATSSETSFTSSAASSSSDADSSTTATTTSIDASSTGAFPGNCSSACQVIGDALSSCSVGTTLNTTCLCTIDVEQSYRSCLQCALAMDPTIGNQSTYQAMLDTFINQCASASSNPVTLPPATITMPGNASTTGFTNGTNSTIPSTPTNINTSAITSIVSTTSSSSSSSGASSSAATSAASTADAATSSGAASGAGEKVVYGVGVGLVGLMAAVLV